jgi:hypothetical protein
MLYDLLFFLAIALFINIFLYIVYKDWKDHNE